jgi:hypothetical protein
MITAHTSGPIEFGFDPESHTYSVEGNYCLATSDVIALAGLSDYSGVPLANLEKARWRGTELHKAIHYYEEGDLDLEDVDGEIKPCFERYLKWKDETGFCPIPPFEHALVYEHLDMYIGCHLDLRGYIPGKGLFILDAKTSYPTSGQAKKQTHLRWRMQLESYKQATQTDDAFWAAVPDSMMGSLQKAVLHLHPKAQQTFIDFATDDAAGWDACVTMAQLKLANGYRRPVHQ